MDINHTKLKIVLFGSNPSNSALSSEAFHESTISGRNIRRWLNGLDADFIFKNVSNNTTIKNRPLNKTEITNAAIELSSTILNEKYDAIIAVGKTAAKTLSKANIKFDLEIPHPSGRCRKLNDPQTHTDIRNSLEFLINRYNIDKRDS